MKFAFIIDPIERLDPGHDTSVAFMEAAQELGHEVWITQLQHLSVVNSKAWAHLEPVSLKPVELVQGRWIAAERWYVLGSPQLLPLESMNAVFMRKDPPVTLAYLYATYILDCIDPQKTQVINAPSGLRHANEKMYALQFTEAVPETIVTPDKAIIRQFTEEKGAAVLKPLDGKAGEGILLLDPSDRNLNSLIEVSTKRGQIPVMVQIYLPAAQDGDKRIILLDGEPIGAINRVPMEREFRGNMAAGGSVVRCGLTQRDRQICTQLAPTLQRDGLVFVGIDIIGDYLTEVNVTSPTGVREADRLEGTRLGQQVITWVSIEARQRSTGNSGDD